MTKRSTITIETNTRSRLTGEFPVTAVKKALSYRHPSARFARHAGWNGRVSLITDTGAFPTGLVPTALAAIEKKRAKGFKVKVKDLRGPPPLKVRSLKKVKLGGIKDLFDHQKRCVKAALKHHRGIIKLATGGGKTETMCAIIRALSKRVDGKLESPLALIIVPNRNLLRQTVKRFEKRLGEKVGSIGFGKWEQQRVTVAIPDTLLAKKHKKARKLLWKECQLLMLDECHHGPAAKWMNAIKFCEAYYRFGFSGTPLDRSDGTTLKLVGQTGHLLIDIPASELVRSGHLARPTVRMISIKKPALPDTLAYPDAYDLGVVQNRYFHEKLIRRASKYVAKGLKVLVLVTRIAHGNYLAELLTEAGHDQDSFAWVHGKTKDHVIEAAVEDFEKKDGIPLLIASPIFGEGTDIPAIDVLIVADGGKAVIRTVQKAGRAMRPKKDRPNECIIMDFANFTHWKLLEHSLERLKTYKREQFPIKE